MFRPTTILVGCLATCLIASNARSENWSQFRGSNLNGLVKDATLPLEWGPENQILWKVKLPGIGWSQPIVWGDRVFVTTAVSDKQAKPNAQNKGPGLSGYTDLLSRGTVALPPPLETYQWKVMCLDAATGKTLWERLAREGR